MDTDAINKTRKRARCLKQLRPCTWCWSVPFSASVNPARFPERVVAIFPELLLVSVSVPVRFPAESRVRFRVGSRVLFQARFRAEFQARFRVGFQGVFPARSLVEFLVLSREQFRVESRILFQGRSPAEFQDSSSCIGHSWIFSQRNVSIQRLSETTTRGLNVVENFRVRGNRRRVMRSHARVNKNNGPT
jgi:hypothetical protein